MIEPELAFSTLDDCIDCSEDYLKYCLKYIMLNNEEDLKLFDKFVGKGLIDRLEKIVDNKF